MAKRRIRIRSNILKEYSTNTNIFDELLLLLFSYADLAKSYAVHQYRRIIRFSEAYIEAIYAKSP
jgi:hypothetical protein